MYKLIDIITNYLTENITCLVILEGNPFFNKTTQEHFKYKINYEKKNRSS